MDNSSNQLSERSSFLLGLIWKLGEGLTWLGLLGAFIFPTIVFGDIFLKWMSGALNRPYHSLIVGSVGFFIFCTIGGIGRLIKFISEKAAVQEQ
jgi:hypothetical protein